ncbi:TPA: plasmid recombination protein, partial [Escherichia coli]|nr:plasmid recombination protein [Escherichia coli]
MLNNLNERSRKFQFIHLEAYSLQANQQGGKNAKFNKEVKARTVSEVLGEVLRKEGFCNHIQEPEAPGVLYGDLNNIEADCKAYHQNHKNIDKNGKAKALRSDANVLLAGVISLEGIPENYDDWENYKKDAVTFLIEKYGENLAAVVEHTDEENPHLHFYIVPRSGQRLDELHDGKNAVLELKKKEPKALKGKQNKAYIEGMRNFQDDFYNKVSKNFGLTKIGPARSRVSRKTYFEQKKAAEEYRKTLKQIEQNKFFIDAEFEQA